MKGFDKFETKAPLEVKPFIPCRKCPQLKDGGPRAGYYFTDLEGYKVLKECDCHIKWRKQVEFDLKVYDANVRCEYDFDDYLGDKNTIYKARQIAEEFPRFKYKSMIYFYGKNSTQKTTIAKCIGKKLIAQGYTVKYIVMNELIKALINRDEFNLSEDTSWACDTFLRECREVDLLIIDESFDSKKVTLYKSGFQIPYLDEFLRKRFDGDKKSILFISNTPIDQIEQEGYGISLKSFVERNTSMYSSVITFNDDVSQFGGVINRESLFHGRDTDLNESNDQQ